VIGVACCSLLIFSKTSLVRRRSCTVMCAALLLLEVFESEWPSVLETIVGLERVCSETTFLMVGLD
jgi:hypothetical protein